MPNIIKIGTFLGLQLAVRRSIFIAYPLLATVLAVLGALWLKLPSVQALGFGIACALLHLVGEFWHNLGHAAAARSSGHPMTGITFWGLLATSVYPKDEGRLSPEIHIRRALGGPLGSSLLTLLAFGSVLAAQNVPGLLLYTAWFFFMDNLLVYSLGAFLPLGFTDGSTILSWLKKRQRRQP